MLEAVRASEEQRDVRVPLSQSPHTALQASGNWSSNVAVKKALTDLCVQDP